MKKLICSFIFTSYLLTFTVNTFAALPSMIDGQNIPSLAPLVEKVSPAVVNISVSANHSNQQAFPDLFRFFNPYDEPEMIQPPFVGLGSGVIVDAKKGYIITNFHVIANRHIRYY